MYQKILLVIMRGCLVGCASAKQYVAMPDQNVSIEDPSKGRIYVIRPSSYGYAIPMSISDNNQLIGDTGPNSYLCWEREPAEITINGKSENNSWIKLSLTAGETRYIMQHIQLGFALPRNRLEEINQEKALKYLKKAKPANAWNRNKKGKGIVTDEGQNK